MTVADVLGKIRKPAKRSSRGSVRTGYVLYPLLGAVLGIISKWLDTIPSSAEDPWWLRAVSTMDLRNVLSSMPVWLMLALAISVFSPDALRAAVNTFLFFAGMCAAYHICTLLFAGFDNTAYMMTWYRLTLISPFLAAVCWYAKGSKAVSLIIGSAILGVIAYLCFSEGWLYFYFTGVANAVIFVLSAAVLYDSPKQIAVITVTGLLLPVIADLIRSYILR